MQNQSRDSFPSDTKKNPKDCMPVTLRSGNDLKGSNEAQKKHIGVEIEKADQGSTSYEMQQGGIGLVDENLKMKKPSEDGKDETVYKEEVRVYQPPVPFP